MSGTHSHAAADSSALRSREGLKAVRISTFGLLITAAVQFAIVLIGGSAALLADSLHNFGDVFTTVALWIAFSSSRRAANRSYTYGYDRFEDLVGVGIVLIIGASAFIAGRESLNALEADHQVTHVPVSIAAACVGIIGNELVARYKLRIGKLIHSVSLIADGNHSRVDGLVSAGAAVGLIGVLLGYKQADAIAGGVITLVIVWVTVLSAREVFLRLADKIDPAIVDKIEAIANDFELAHEVHEIRARWAGRSLLVELHIAADERLPLVEAHALSEEIRHRIMHEVDGVSQVLIHVDPWSEGTDQSSYHLAHGRHDEDHE